MGRARWRGTDRELEDLQAAAHHNCVCDLPGIACLVHGLINTDDQRLLDHLLFARRAAEHFQKQEHDPTCFVPKREYAE